MENYNSNDDDEQPDPINLSRYFRRHKTRSVLPQVISLTLMVGALVLVLLLKDNWSQGIAQFFLKFGLKK